VANWANALMAVLVAAVSTVVTLGIHAAVTAMNALDCLRSETAMVLLAAAQAVDLRGGPARLGAGTRKVYETVPAGGCISRSRSRGGTQLTWWGRRSTCQFSHETSACVTREAS